MNIKAVEQFDLNKVKYHIKSLILAFSFICSNENLFFQYHGTWFLIRRTPTIFGQGICSRAEYTLINETSFTLKKIESVANHSRTLEVLGKLQEPSKKIGKFWLTPKQQSVRLTLPLWVIGTDYKNYAVLWTCIDVVPSVFNLSYRKQQGKKKPLNYFHPFQNYRGLYLEKRNCHQKQQLQWMILLIANCRNIHISQWNNVQKYVRGQIY